MAGLEEPQELNDLLQRLMDVLDEEIPWEERFLRRLQAQQRFIAIVVKNE